MKKLYAKEIEAAQGKTSDDNRARCALAAPGQRHANSYAATA